jgi:hypothetical protein
VEDADIAKALHAHVRTVERVREKCVREGIEAALNHTRPKKTRAKPKHGSWLSMAEIELSVLHRQCLKARIPDQATLIEKVAAWEYRRNDQGASVRWQFTTEDARIKLHRLYPTINVC